MLQTPPPFTPQQRINNDFQQYPQAGMMAAALKGLSDPSLYPKIGVQPYPTNATVPYMNPATGTYGGARVAEDDPPLQIQPMTGGAGGGSRPGAAVGTVLRPPGAGRLERWQQRMNNPNSRFNNFNHKPQEESGLQGMTQVASNVLPIPGMAGQAPAWQPTGLQIAHGENASRNPGTGVLPFPLPGGPMGNERLQNIYQQNPPLR